MNRLEGKVAIVTGGARGQGAAHARRIVEEGGRVVVTDVLVDDGKASVEALGGERAVFVRHDASDETQWAGVVDAATRNFGGVDVLVNNAGIHHITPIEEETLDGLRALVDVNLVGVFLGIQAVIEPMRRRGGGSIVNISSLAGLEGFWGHGAYGATKWAVRGLSKTAAIELGPSGIRVNSIHPGVIDTPMLPPGAGAAAATIPLQRIGAPADVADLVVYLASDESSFVSGAEIAIDCGSGAGAFNTIRASASGGTGRATT
jgi:3alpha(or 20beta)-hydroxysteroid dehydrogenase